MSMNISGSFISWEADKEEEAYLIDHLYVSPEERRQGKGRAMLREALAEMREEGLYNSVILCAMPEVEDIELADLVEFYESEGFRIEYAGEVVTMRCELA